jgi:hypothetical protein
LNLNSSVDHDENSEYNEKTRTCRALWIHPMGEYIILDNLLIFISISHVSRSQLRNLGLIAPPRTGKGGPARGDFKMPLLLANRQERSRIPAEFRRRAGSGGFPDRMAVVNMSAGAFDDHRNISRLFNPQETKDADTSQLR